MPRAEPRTRRPLGAGTAAAVGLAAALGAAGAHAQGPVNVWPTFSADLTWTNNVDLDPRESRESDFVLTLTPGFGIDHTTPRTFLRGYVALPILLYARTGDENNEVRPLVDLNGNVEVVKDFFYVDASASVQQTYLDPFGQRPSGLVSATDNRLETQTYRVSPYIRGTLGGTTSYELRDENVWTLLDDSPLGSETEYINRLVGTINRTPAPYGWGADVERTLYKFEDQLRDQYVELARLRGVYQSSPTLQLYLTAGYERSQFVLTESEGAIYGGGLRWRPTDRTLVDAFAEHRFFGTSYAVILDHRTPLTTWTFRASRNITSFPEVLARIPAGGFVPGILNQLFLNRIPDQRERAEFIARYMQDRGLPLFVSDPLSLYSQRINLEELVSGTVSVLGARNTLVLSAYYNKTTPITAEGDSLPPEFSSFVNNTQTGAWAIWTYALGSNSSLTLRAEASETKANEPLVGESSQWAFYATVNRAVSPRTTLVGGLRFQGGESDFSNNYDEAAVFVGFTYTYR